MMMNVKEFIDHLDLHGGMSNRQHCGPYNMRPTQRALERMAETHNQQFIGDPDYEHMLAEPEEFDGLYCSSGSNMWNIMDVGGGTFAVPFDLMKEVNATDLIELGYVKECQVVDGKIKMEA